MILAGDVGGTKVNLALVDPAAQGTGIVAEDRFETDEHSGLESIVEGFLSRHAGPSRRIDRACFGIACPVVGGECRMTNLPWTFSQDSIGRSIGTDRVTFINDLEATAYGLDSLGEDRFTSVAEGTPRGPTAALIAAGTGLGAAVLTRLGDRPHVLPSESGHADFAPRDAFEDALLVHLRARYGRVSTERVVSGPGLLDLYGFLRDTGREVEPAWLAERLVAADEPPEVISRAGLAGEAPICEAALERFVAAYGAATGNLALSVLALAGVYLGGGIAPAILPALCSGTFVRAFRTKGRLSDLLAEVPIRVIEEPRAALLGAARYARLSGLT